MPNDAPTWEDTVDVPSWDDTKPFTEHRARGGMDPETSSG